MNLWCSPGEQVKNWCCWAFFSWGLGFPNSVICASSYCTIILRSRISTEPDKAVLTNSRWLSPTLILELHYWRNNCLERKVTQARVSEYIFVIRSFVTEFNNGLASLWVDDYRCWNRHDGFEEDKIRWWWPSLVGVRRAHWVVLGEKGGIDLKIRAELSPRWTCWCTNSVARRCDVVDEKAAIQMRCYVS